ncbi:PAS domain S-box-containing protein [Bradyrhizobium lablabi]|uniref:histidine kinase n=1 Tax=Bradyrhizobium lablabi TaxID=722472 RepID=A0A1M6YVH9_9BRAD|nr:PAS domain S-box protein [Bradyrhizobium lablabi]SHL22311.1 PAS domain S-box-containing protein [Bradyrhizobium lablabi]
MRLSTRLTVAMVALVLLATSAVGVLTYRNIATFVLPRALDRISTHAQLLATELAASVRGARADVIGFRSDNAVIDIMTARLRRGTDPAAETTEMEWRRRLGQRFAAELASKPNYHEFRYIGVDDGGRELVRVDRSDPGGPPRIVPESDLQRKDDRAAFSETIRLADGEVYVSPVDFNQDHGVFETPHVPVLRVATPVHTPDGRPFGIVIINVDMRPAFARIRAGAVARGHSYVVNDQGDYLVHPDPAREFGFEFGKPEHIQEEIPDFTQILKAGDSTARVFQDGSGRRFGMGVEMVRLAEGPLVAVIQAVPYSVLTLAVAAIRDSTLMAGFLAAFCAFVLAVIVARSLTRPLVQMTKVVQGFSRDQNLPLPSGGGHEIGELARAFADMAADSRAKTKALNQEVEERRRAFEHEQLFIAAVESSNDAIITQTLDGVITGWNPGAERLFGFTAQEAIGNSIDIIVPDPLRGEAGSIRDRIRAGERIDYHETVRVDKNSRWIDVSLGISPIRSQSGAIIGAAKVARDITAQKMAQEALLESEQMARDVVDNALEAFIQTDEDGHILEWNPQAEAIFGWSRQEAVGRHLVGLLLPENMRPYYESMKRRMMRMEESAGVGQRFETEAMRKDGFTVKVEVSLKALRRRSGYVFNAFVRDLTQEIAAEEQLRQAQKMDALGQLTGGIAHDFNNVLTVITGTIEILADEVSGKPNMAAIATLISEAADRGAELTGRLLAFARKQPLQPLETDINRLIVESAKLMRPALGEHIEVEAMLADGLWTALVDPGQLSSALLNLSINARDAMPGGGKLTLETNNVSFDEDYAAANGDAQVGDYIMIAVADTGTGIPEAIRDRVFDPFFSTKGVGKGTGLGLSMVYGFVKQSGGHIKLYSEEGFGTTFKLYLPKADAAPEAIAEQPLPAEMEGGSETILVVEDDPLVRAYVNTQLQSLGYKTLSAANGTDALAIADSGAAFDLLFTDVIMPGGMNGRQLAVEMAKRRARLRVLFTSGYTENAIVHHGRLDSGVLLLAKPYRKLDLARMLRIAMTAAGIFEDGKRRES